MSAHLLPEEVLIKILESIELLEAMFPLPSELTFADSTTPALALLRASTSSADLASSLPDDLRVIILLHLQDDLAWPLEVELVLRLRDEPASTASSSTTTRGVPPTLTVRPPAWLSRSRFAELLSGLPPLEGEEVVDDVLMLIEHLRSEGPSFIPPLTPEPVANNGGVIVEPDELGIDRVWFWLPSLSTKEKRDDIVRMAPVWNLTGFVLAGKPGILCVEGRPMAVQEYLGWIKSVSWSDIPSFQKVTERHRQPLVSERLFDKMQEITNLITHRGFHGNRGEMGDVRKWIEARGVGPDVLGKVLNLG